MPKVKEETTGPLNTVHMNTLFVLHTAIDCIRYGQKAASFSKELPDIDVKDVSRYAYSMIMKFEQNFKKSYFDDTTQSWKEDGTGLYGIPEMLYRRLANQTDACLPFVNNVFKTAGVLTHDNIQEILHFVQDKEACPVKDVEDVHFSDMEVGYKEYVSFQCNVAINRLLRAFNGTKTRNLKKSNLTSGTIDDLITLKIYERGEAPKDPTPVEGEIFTFATDEAKGFDDVIEVEATDLHVLKTAQAEVKLWWDIIDMHTDRANLVDIMSTEARDFLKERQANPPTATFVMAE